MPLTPWTLWKSVTGDQLGAISKGQPSSEVQRNIFFLLKKVFWEVYEENQSVSNFEIQVLSESVDWSGQEWPLDMYQFSLAWTKSNYWKQTMSLVRRFHILLMINASITHCALIMNNVHWTSKWWNSCRSNDCRTWGATTKRMCHMGYDSLAGPSKTVTVLNEKFPFWSFIILSSGTSSLCYWRIQNIADLKSWTKSFAAWNLSLSTASSSS